MHSFEDQPFLFCHAKTLSTEPFTSVLIISQQQRKKRDRTQASSTQLQGYNATHFVIRSCDTNPLQGMYRNTTTEDGNFADRRLSAATTRNSTGTAKHNAGSTRRNREFLLCIPHTRALQRPAISVQSSRASLCAEVGPDAWLKLGSVLG
jgi:hypothetical protein